MDNPIHQKETVIRTIGKIILVSIVWVFIYYFVLSYFENANPSSIYKLTSIYLIGQVGIIYYFIKQRKKSAEEKHKSEKKWKWVYILGAILGIIILFYIIFPSEEQVNTQTDAMELMKSHIVYVLYDFSDKNNEGSIYSSSASGSGVIFYANNSMMQIFTNRHVIDCGYTQSCYQRLSENIKVRTQDGKMHEVSKVMIAPHGLDIAVLEVKIPSSNNYNAVLIRENEIINGEKVTAIGYPTFGVGNVLEFTISDGVITNPKRSLLMRDGFSFEAVDSDAYTNHGSSGGGLFDEEGNLIGINTWANLEQQQSFAININVIDNFESYFYCEKGTYPLGDNQCMKYCKESEVLGQDNQCHEVCSQGKYCAEDSVCCDKECYALKYRGYSLGSDCQYHDTCGSGYCSEVSICCKDKCYEGCPAGFIFGTDCKCHNTCGESYCSEDAICCENKCYEECPVGYNLATDCKCYPKL